MSEPMVHFVLTSEAVAAMTDTEFEEAWSAYGRVVRLAVMAGKRGNANALPKEGAAQAAEAAPEGCPDSTTGAALGGGAPDGGAA